MSTPDEIDLIMTGWDYIWINLYFLTKLNWPLGRFMKAKCKIIEDYICGIDNDAKNEELMDCFVFKISVFFRMNYFFYIILQGIRIIFSIFKIKNQFRSARSQYIILNGNYF